MNGSRILAVDDNRDNVALVEFLLRAAGHEPVTASNGPDAIRLAEELHPDLILMDIQMPGMDGYEATAAIRCSTYGRRVRIVAITAFAMVGDRDRILSAGFDGYITKPITPQTFAEEIARYLPTTPIEL